MLNYTIFALSEGHTDTPRITIYVRTSFPLALECHLLNGPKRRSSGNAVTRIITLFSITGKFPICICSNRPCRKFSQKAIRAILPGMRKCKTCLAINHESIDGFVPAIPVIMPDMRRNTIAPALKTSVIMKNSKVDGDYAE